MNIQDIRDAVRHKRPDLKMRIEHCNLTASMKLHAEVNGKSLTVALAGHEALQLGTLSAGLVAVELLKRLDTKAAE